MKFHLLFSILGVLIISSCHSPKTDRNAQNFVEVEQSAMSPKADSSFYLFAERLSLITQQQDLEELQKVLAPIVSESNDGCKGCTPGELAAYLTSNSEKRFWEAMEKTLKYGFLEVNGIDPFSIAISSSRVQDSSYYVAPSFIQTVVLNCPDSLLIIDQNVIIFSSPDSSSQPIDIGTSQKFRCNCNMNTRTENSFKRIGGKTWVKMFLPDGQTGYVLKENTSLSISRTIYVSKFEEGWKITAIFLKSGC